MRLMFAFIAVGFLLAFYVNIVSGSQPIIAWVSILFSIAGLIQAIRVVIGTRARKDMW